MAEVLPPGLPPVPESELRGSPGWGVGRPDAGRGGVTELRAEAAAADLVLDLLLRLHLICFLRCLLEHFCLQLT